MSQYFDIVVISSSGEVLDVVRNRECVKPVPIEMTRSITPFKDIKAAWQFDLPPKNRDVVK
jgi:hypothetical protein